MPVATATNCAARRIAGDRLRRSSRHEKRQRRQPCQDQQEPSAEDRGDDSDAAAARCRRLMQRPLVRAVEHRRPAQQRDQRTGAEARDEAGARDRR
jgi:hypothetical protein